MPALTPAPVPVRPATSHQRARAVSGWPTAVKVALAGAGILLALGVAPAPASALPAQDPSTTAGVGGTATTTGLSVTTTAPITTADPVTTAARTGSTGPGSSQVDEENRKIWAVVAGLILVAVALTALTVRYWRRTRPLPPTQAVPIPPSAAGSVPAAIHGGRWGAADDEPTTSADSTVVAPIADDAVAAVAVADAPIADDAVLDGAVVDGAVVDDAVVADATVDDPVEAAPETLQIALADIAAEAGGADAAEPVVMPGEVTSRRAVAGADHAGADAGWEPHATGEQAMVVVPDASTRPRLTPAQRAAAFEARQAP